MQACLPSRFLEELPQDSLEWFGKNIERNEEKSKALARSHLEGLKNLLE
jgi:ATP-dependent DNA helicase Rep